MLGLPLHSKVLESFNRAAMGLPDSETALEELMNRVAGELVMEGCVAKVADDCYCGGDTIDSALNAWERLLAAFASNNLGLNPAKTFIFPKAGCHLGMGVGNGYPLSKSPQNFCLICS